MIFKLSIPLVLLLCIYLLNLMWTDKNAVQLANKPNLVFFTVDTLRADHLSPYGYPRKTTPNLEAIIDDAIIFDNAFTVANHSAPAHASLLTGLYPPQLGINNNQLEIPMDITTLAEILKQQGYKTAAFVGDTVVGEEGNFDQGFDTFSVDLIQADTTISVTKKWAQRGWKKAQNWLEQWLDNKHSLTKNEQKPFFLWFHANHPHGNYSPPPDYQNLFIKQPPKEVQQLQKDANFSLDSYFRKRIEEGNIDQPLMDWVVSQYDGEIAFSDYLFGQLVDFLKRSGEYDNTLIIFIADHGELLFEHWRPGKIRSAGHHANLYYYSVLHIPLVIKPAKSSAIISGQRINSLVSIVDVFNSSLDLLGLKKIASIPSQSFLPTLQNPAIKHRSEVFFSGQAYDNNCTGILNQQWQLVRCKMQERKREVLFYLSKQQQQQQQINMDKLQKLRKQKIKQLEKKLDKWTDDFQALAVTDKKVSDQMREHLKRSGYLDKRENL